MNRFLLILGLLFGAAAWSGESPPGKPSLASLGWLAGRWSFEQGGRTVSEHWMAPDGGTMLGMSRTVAKEKTVEYEFLLIRSDEQGILEYVAKPSRQAETAFKLVRASESEAVFENLQHDFPQRISYTLKPDGSLLAAIEGQKEGKLRRREFPFRREPPDKPK